MFQDKYFLTALDKYLLIVEFLKYINTPEHKNKKPALISSKSKYIRP